MWRLSFSHGRHSQIIRLAILDFPTQGVLIQGFNSKLNHRNFYLHANGCLFNASSRHLVVERCKVEEPKNLREILWKKYSRNITAYNRRKCTKKLAQVLDCSIEKASIVLMNDPSTFLYDFDNTINKITFLLQEGIETEFILNNIWILKLPLSDLKSRINCIKIWEIEPHLYQEFTPLLKLPYIEFYRTSSKFINERSIIPYGNRIIYLSKALECSVIEVSERIIKSRHILRKDFNLLDNNLHAYYKFGFQKQEILRDLSCLANSVNRIYDRLNLAIKRGMQPLKTWFVRCSDHVFNRTLELYDIRKNAFLPYETREDFLATVFELDAESVEEMKRNCSVIETMDGVKLKEMIEFLINAGYSKQQIISKLKPTVLETRITTLKNRFSELRTLGITYPPLWKLYVSEPRYQCLVERITSEDDTKND